MPRDSGAPGGVERAALEEDVGGLGDLRRLGQHLREREVEVRVGVAVELGRHGVRAEPGRHAAGGLDRTQRRELGVAVEAVAGLRLERRRAVRAHPAAMALDGFAQALLARGTRRADGREDAAAAGVQLLVARAARAQRELLDAVAAERRMRMAVDEPRDRAEPAAVDLDDLAVEQPAGRACAPPPRSTSPRAEHVRVLEHVDLAERGPAQRRLAPRGRRELREIADEQLHASARAAPTGSRSRPAAAASSASS